MTTFSRKRTTDDYLKRISAEPASTVKQKKDAVRSFTDFLKEKYKGSPEEFCEWMLSLKNKKGEEEFIDSLYDVLQNWINWSVENGLGAYTLQVRFINLRFYLYHLGLRTNPQDIKQLLRFPKKNKEERYPLKRSELRDIVLTQARYPKRQALYLACSSSGMRIGEALSIRKKDLDFTQKRIKVRIKAEYTKTRQARTTFLSKECEEKMRTYLDRLGDDDYVFTESTKNGRSILEINALRRSIERLGLTQRYSSNGFYKITSHSFRAYFFTIAARKHGENYAHKLTGHGGYLMQYDRMTDEEKLKMYLELEPDLLVFDQTKNELEIEKLKIENEIIHSLQDEIAKLREEQARMDKDIILRMKEKGVIP